MQKSRSKSKRSIIPAIITSVALVFLVGCADKDVTTLPQYNFSSFANTVWKTKTKTAIVLYGSPPLLLWPPSRYDPAGSNYITLPNTRVLAVLPAGTRLRITRLMEDQGERGGVEVEGVVEDGTNTPKAVYVDKTFLANVWWASKGPTTNKTWGVNHDMLEKP